MSSTKTVKFRRDSPTGGPFLDHQRSDSGVGSFSDSESRGTYPDRAFTASDYESPNILALQDALAKEARAKEYWITKATELDHLLSGANKELKEIEARLRALEDHVDELEDDKSKLSKSNKDLTEEATRLREDLKEFKDLKDVKRTSRRKSNSPPVMSGAIPADEEKKLRRSSSKRHTIKESERAEREKERERIARDMAKELEREKEQREKNKEMDRLRKRFDNGRGDESDAKSSNASSSKSHRSRRDSYVEPLGAPAPRPQAQVPPSPRQYSYSSAQYSQQPTYQSTNVPRAPHPSVVVSYSDTFAEGGEDGLYHPHPLPNKSQRSPDRRGEWR